MHIHDTNGLIAAMTLAIMQPYLFPYIGYFQLIAAVDKFVVLDDVNYIKKGWVNRNNLLEGGAAGLFTVPLSGASQNRKINELELSDEAGWKEKLWRRIGMVYGKAPQFDVVAPMVQQGLIRQSSSIATYNVSIIQDVLDYLHVETEIVPSSSSYGNEGLKGPYRIMDICVREGAKRYINPIGGMELYDKAEFRAHGIDLYFLRTRAIAYKQGRHSFVPNLSILDVMMWNPPEQIAEWLGEYDLE